MSNHEELTIKVKNIIEQIRPYLQADGGDISFVELTEDKGRERRTTGSLRFMSVQPYDSEKRRGRSS